MAKYIDADEYRKVIECFTEKDPLGHSPVDLLDAMPAADVAEVRRGEWKIDSFVDFDDGTIGVMLKCSVCGITQGVLTNYCPNCGAKMDEVDE